MTFPRNPKDPYRTTFHRDGSVTVWDVYSQTWKRLPAAECSEGLLVSLPHRERAVIEKMQRDAREANA